MARGERAACQLVSLGSARQGGRQGLCLRRELGMRSQKLRVRPALHPRYKHQLEQLRSLADGKVKIESNVRRLGEISYFRDCAEVSAYRHDNQLLGDALAPARALRALHGLRHRIRRAVTQANSQ